MRCVRSYRLHMFATRFGLVLVLAALANAQQTAHPPEAAMAEPNLPVIDHKACPGEGRSIPDWKIWRNTLVFSSWGDTWVVLDTLKTGEKVTVVAGVNVIREPGQAVIKQGRQEFSDAKGLSLTPRDVILVYGFHADGNYDLWAKVIWFTESYENIAGKATNAASLIRACAPPWSSRTA